MANFQGMACAVEPPILRRRGPSDLGSLDPAPALNVDLRQASEIELIAMARDGAEPDAARCLAVLYERFYPQVVRWCLRICGNREEAADLAQEVFLRVHSRLDSFRMESSFSTWLYTVTRSVTINQGIRRNRRETGVVELEQTAEPVAPGPDPGDRAARKQELAQVRRTMQRDLKPLEAQVVYLHYVDGLSLPAITKMLKLENRSGAKAYIVNGVRKLKRRLVSRETGGRQERE